MDNRKIEQKKVKQVVIDAGLHKEIKLLATRLNMTIKTLLEGLIADGLAKGVK